MEEVKLDFEEMIAASDEIRAKKVKVKKPPTSVKPLKFDILDGDSDLKVAIVKKINEKNLVYSDLYSFCAKLKDGDIEAGNKMASNLINGLKNRHTFIDTTLSLLCNFLNIDIHFVDKKQDEEENGEETEIES